jgi:hypothetical protein
LPRNGPQPIIIRHYSTINTYGIGFFQITILGKGIIMDKGQEKKNKKNKIPDTPHNFIPEQLSYLEIKKTHSLKS